MTPFCYDTSPVARSSSAIPTSRTNSVSTRRELGRACSWSAGVSVTLLGGGLLLFGVLLVVGSAFQPHVPASNWGIVAFWLGLLQVVACLAIIARAWLAGRSRGGVSA